MAARFDNSSHFRSRLAWKSRSYSPGNSFRILWSHFKQISGNRAGRFCRNLSWIFILFSRLRLTEVELELTHLSMFHSTSVLVWRRLYIYAFLSIGLFSEKDIDSKTLDKNHILNYKWPVCEKTVYGQLLDYNLSYVKMKRAFYWETGDRGFYSRSVIEVLGVLACNLSMKCVSISQLSVRLRSNVELHVGRLGTKLQFESIQTN